MKIFLWILAILALLLVLLFRARLGIHAAFGAAEARADLTLGPFRVRLAPRPEPPQKKAVQKKEKSGKPKETAELRKKIPRPSAGDIREAVETLGPVCKKALRRTRRGIRIRPLQLSVTVGGAADPAEAAELYGLLHTLVWTVMPPLEQLVEVRDPGIHIGLDFDLPNTRAEGEFGISIRVGTLIAVGAEVGIPTLRWLLRYWKKQRRPSPTGEAPETADHTAA